MDIAISSGELKKQRSLFFTDTEWTTLCNESKQLSRILNKKLTLSQTARLKLFYAADLLFDLVKKFRSKNDRG